MNSFTQTISTYTRALCVAYASVLFNYSPWFGLAIMATTFLVPVHGVTGLAGTILALAVARGAGFSAKSLEDGRLIYNSALSTLLLSCWYPLGSESWPSYLLLLVLVSVAALALSVLLNHYSILLNGVPAMSLPFWCLGTALHWFLVEKGYPWAYIASFQNDGWPDLLRTWSLALGEISFTASPWAGVIVTLLLLAASRLHVLHALVGFSVAWLLLGTMGFPLETTSWLYLNCILCAMALGGVFYTPSRPALLLAALGSGLCAALGMALLRVLPLVDAPILTLPYIVVTLGLVSALRWRTAYGSLRPVLFPAKNPEAAFRTAQLHAARAPEAELPHLAPPFEGEWVVTQGFDGGITHSGAWQYALDFEVANLAHRSSRPRSAELSDYPSFDAPIISPAAGRIVQIVDDVKDNPIGQTNLEQNWGNLVVLEIAPHLYALLCHFRFRGLRVREGERVRQGQLLGYLGNSGRSPLPHLHLQMQTSPEVGAPSIPFRLHGYRTPVEGNAAGRYRFTGLPREQEALSGCRTVRWLTQTAAHWANEEQNCRIITSQGESEERLALSAEPYGVLCWRSLPHGTEFRGQIVAGVFTPLSYHGSEQSILRLLWLAGRIPLAPYSGMEWEESIDLDFGTHPLMRPLRQLLAPFLNLRPQCLQGKATHYDPDNQRYQVSCTLPDRTATHRASSLEFIFGAGLRLVSIRHETAQGWLRSIASEKARDRISVPKNFPVPALR